MGDPTGEVFGTARAVVLSEPGLSCAGYLRKPGAIVGKPYIPTLFQVIKTTPTSFTIRLEGLPLNWADADSKDLVSVDVIGSTANSSCFAAVGAIAVAHTNSPAVIAWFKGVDPVFTISKADNYLKVRPNTFGKKWQFPPVADQKQVTLAWRSRITIAGQGSRLVQTTPEIVRAYASQRWQDLVPIYRDVFFAEAADDAVRDTLLASWYGLKPPDIQKYIGPAFFKRTFFPVVTEIDQIIAKTLALLENAYNDPPLADYARVARVAKANVSSQLPSCAAAAAAARSFCERFRKAAIDWTAALGRVEGLAQALATTVGRESGAAKAHDAKALLLQQHAGLALIPKLRAADSSEEAAARELAAAMRSGHFDPRLTADQAQHGIALFLHELAARGVSAQDVDAILDGAVLQARPLDLVALLDGKLSAPSPPAKPSAPHPAARTISSVTFGGSPRAPSIVVRGQNLGAQPAPNPSGSPSNQPPLCPVTIQGNAGLDYGTSLYLNNTTANWAAGRYRPSSNELDCIGLIVTKFTPTEVDYRLGSAYQQFSPKYQLAAGDTVQVAVNGTTKTVHVKYGATVTN